MIAHLVSNLPEVYQPVYGHPELSSQVSRPSHDRFEIIAQIHDSLQSLLGRPLNVLDLGCAQGFFSLNLAERGATVRGVDFLDKNIALCKALADEHPQLNAAFEIGRVEDIIGHLEQDQFDIVLGLSVFHHIVHEHGSDAVKQLLEHAANLSAALIVELALHEEPLYWGPSQPQDPRTLLESIAFVHETARHATHLSPIARPLYVASNRYWLLDGQAGIFDSWTCEPHALAHGTHERSRRYFSSSTLILKQYRLDHPRGAYNKSEFIQERHFLQKPPSGFSVPELTLHGENKAETWLVMQRLPGKLLLDLLQEGAKIDHRAILLAVLSQLSALEAAGLCHNDVRTWNILVAEDGATHLIDFGSISPKAKDVVWPTNPFFAFFIFVHEIATGQTDNPNPLRTIALSPFSLPLPYQVWARQLWQRPLAEWSFRLMHETLLQTQGDLLEGAPTMPVEAWMLATEEAMQTLKEHFFHRMNYAQEKALQADVTAQRAEAVAQAAANRAREAEAVAQSAENRAIQAEAVAHSAENRAMQAVGGLQAVYDSNSWRVTAPLRYASTTARWFYRGSKAWLTFAPKSRPHRIMRQAALHLKSFVVSRPRLRSFTLRCLTPFPGLRLRLQLLSRPSLPELQAKALIEGPEHFSQHARQIYNNVKTAIELRQQGLD